MIPLNRKLAHIGARLLVRSGVTQLMTDAHGNRSFIEGLAQGEPMLPVTAIPLNGVTAAIRDTMGTIREDVRLGTAGNIEADAVLLNVAYAIARELDMDDEQRGAFLRECDLENVIESEAFHHYP